MVYALTQDEAIDILLDQISNDRIVRMSKLTPLYYYPQRLANRNKTPTAFSARNKALGKA